MTYRAIMKVSLRCIGLVALFPFAACTSDDPDTQNAGLSSEEAFAQIATTYCERAFECEATAPEGLAFDSISECAIVIAENLTVGEDAAAFHASIDAGRITWDEEDAAYCAGLVESGLNGLACADFWNDSYLAINRDDPRGDDLGEGRVLDGDACTIDADCARESSECADLVCG